MPYGPLIRELYRQATDKMITRLIWYTMRRWSGANRLTGIALMVSAIWQSRNCLLPVSQACESEHTNGHAFSGFPVFAIVYLVEYNVILQNMPYVSVPL